MRPMSRPTDLDEEMSSASQMITRDSRLTEETKRHVDLIPVDLEGHNIKCRMERISALKIESMFGEPHV